MCAVHRSPSACCSPVESASSSSRSVRRRSEEEGKDNVTFQLSQIVSTFHGETSV